jgi:hypothetical protein
MLAATARLLSQARTITDSDLRLAYAESYSEVTEVACGLSRPSASAATIPPCRPTPPEDAGGRAYADLPALQQVVTRDGDRGRASSPGRRA